MADTTTTTTPIPPSTTPPTATTTSESPTTTTSEETTTTTTSPTTTPSPTSTTSTTSTTSEETTSTTSTSETTSETTSSTSSTTSSTSSLTTPLTTSSTSSQLTTSTSTNGLTATVVVTEPVASASQSAVSDNSSDDDGGGFFGNTGAVAGVFTVVGLVALIIVFVLATNVIRRRRAKKFDDEVAEAAAEANANPRYPFDDYDDPAPSGGYGSYSDPDSHGTMSQVPLTHPAESYNMNEFNGGYGPSYGTTASAVGAGAAGIGTLARRNTNTYGDVSNGNGGYGGNPNGAHPVVPYNAFAGPLGGMPADPYDPYTAGNLGIKRQPSRGATDLLDAAGIGATAAGAGAALNRGPSQNTDPSLDRQKSLATHRTLSPDNSNGSHSGKTQESYAAHYQPDFRPDAHQYQPTTGGSTAPPPSAGDALPNPFARDGGSDEDAYGVESYIPAVTGRQSPSHDGRESIRDEEDYGRAAGRTLKVCKV
ncbi:hypothetical protein ACEPAH_5187 [Sanghuangporus vaninii]